MLPSILFALATLSASYASTCDPLTTSGCPSDTALASSFGESFTEKSAFFLEVNSKGVAYSSEGLSMTISDRFDNPSLKSNFYIMFGKVEVVLKASQGQGIISSFYLQSDDLDEVDIELFGTDTTQFQSNYFSKGVTGNYDRGLWIPTGSDPTQNFHTYTIEWTENALSWSVDGKVVRTLQSNSPEGYPQSPMYIMMGSWAGGDPSNSPGTIEWAGGLTDYSKAPFTMYIKSVLVADYSTGKSYSYGDNSGSWQSIVSDGGSINGRKSQADADFAKLQGGNAVDVSTPLVPASTSAAASYVAVSSTTIAAFSTVSVGNSAIVSGLSSETVQASLSVFSKSVASTSALVAASTSAPLSVKPVASATTILAFPNSSSATSLNAISQVANSASEAPSQIFETPGLSTPSLPKVSVPNTNGLLAPTASAIEQVQGQNHPQIPTSAPAVASGTALSASFVTVTFGAASTSAATSIVPIHPSANAAAFNALSSMGAMLVMFMYILL